MSFGILRGLLTLSLFIAFIALWIWAYSKSPRATFEAAARLPLEDDSVVDGRSEST